MRNHQQEYFTVIKKFNQATGLQKSLLLLPTRLALEELSSVVPSSSRLYREVNKYLRQNFSQPQISTQ